MPDVVYDPNRGRVSTVSAEEQLARDQRDFLFRSQLAAQQDANEQRRMKMANDQMSAQERMNADNLAARMAENGTFGDRTSAARDLQDLAGRQQLDVIGAQGKNSLDAARIAIGPQTAALGQRQREYEDQRNDRMDNPDYVMGKMEADMLRGVMPGGGASAKSSIGPTTSGSLPANSTIPDGNPATEPIDATPDDEIAVQSRDHRRVIPGKNQYQFDDKSARTQASMLDQLKGSVDPARFQQAVDMLDNSRKQQSERDVAAQKAKADEVKTMMVNAGVQPKSEYASDPMATKAADPFAEAIRNAIIQKHGGVTPEMRRDKTIAALLSSPNPKDKQAALRMQVDPTFTYDASNAFELPKSQSVIANATEQSTLSQALEASPDLSNAVDAIASVQDPAQFKAAFDKTVSDLSQKYQLPPENVIQQLKPHLAAKLPGKVESLIGRGASFAGKAAKYFPPTAPAAWAYDALASGADGRASQIGIE